MRLAMRGKEMVFLSSPARGGVFRVNGVLIAVGAGSSAYEFAARRSPRSFTMTLPDRQVMLVPRTFRRSARISSARAPRPAARDRRAAGLDEYVSSDGGKFSLDSRGRTWPCNSAAVPGSDGTDHLVDVVLTTSMYWMDLPSGGSRSGGTKLGGAFADTPATVQFSNGDVDLFGATTGGSV
jgi:hypothetical protein